jgi:hypothetical protein
MAVKRITLSLIALSIAAGCTKQPGGDSPQSTTPGQGGQGSLKRMITGQAVPNDLRQIAMFYRLYNTDFNRSPATLEEFKTYIQRDAGKLTQALERGDYVVVWKVNDLSPNTVLAYEKEADGEGKRYLAMGDASVKKVDEHEFKRALGRQ